MKKFDLVTIACVLFITVLFYMLYLANINVSDDALVRISYDNIPVYEEKFDELSDITVALSTEDRLLTVVVRNNTSGETKEFTRAISSAKNTENTIRITKDSVSMIHANCRTKQCMTMIITKSFPTPIICTNGVVVEFVYDDIYDYIHRP